MEKKRILIKIGGKSLIHKSESVAQGIRRSATLINTLVREGNKVIVVLSAIRSETDALVASMIDISSDPDKEMSDLLLSIGEQKSIALLGVSLKDLGIKTVALLGWQAGIVTNKLHSSSSIINIDKTKVEGYLAENDVLLVAGFQGVTVDGRITTLGRGGSDTTAVALGWALGIDECIFLKDVSGVYTCDPKSGVREKLLPHVSYEMLLEVASSGAEIVNFRAAELAKTYNYSIAIRNINDVNKVGTIISNKRSSDGYVIVENQKATLLYVKGLVNQPGTLAPILNIIRENLIKIVYINQSFTEKATTSVSILIWGNSQENTGSITEEINSLHTTKSVSFNTMVSAVSVISDTKLKGIGVVKRIVNKLLSNGVLIYGISTSDIRITFVVGKDFTDTSSKIIDKIMKGTGNE